MEIQGTSKSSLASLSDVSGSQKVYLVHHQIRVERERMMPIVCTMERCYKKGEAHMVYQKKKPTGLGSGVPIQEGAQTKTENFWLCEEEGYSIKAASIVRRVIAIREEEEVRIQVVHKKCDTCNSPTTKNVKTKVLCHCISSLGHSLVYRKCSMGHYAMRGVSCETLYGDSNTLIPG
ncbi:hypothetical protein IGI04_042950 [Brassica rapa subsp. trilocularis]|uniref:Uncharacterized protein n=1 Tax=Brassica rapa subsp. trilocularis TaxID=1813537 RepID=A0ABQ7KH53_BRACM|nr:hypothetical protein IGI04_042950 [Brassica rapa subsp. trilocularis]